MKDAVRTKKRRPAAITIVGLFILLSALINTGAGAYLLWANPIVTNGKTSVLFDLATTDEVFTDEGDALFTGAEAVVIGVVEFVICFGFLTLKEWAWVAAISWQALSLLLELTHFFEGNLDPVGLGLAIILVFLLNQSEVRRTFGILKSNHESASESSITAVN